MNTSKGFLFFYDWEESFSDLDGENFKSLFLAMIKYQRDGTPPPTFDGAARIISSFVFPQIERRIASSKGGKIAMAKRYENRGNNGENDILNKSLNKSLNNTRQDKDIDKTKQNKTIPLNPPAGDDSEIERKFELFWKTYPKKMAKDAALKAYKKLNPNKALSDAILNAIEEQKKSEQWKDVKFIPYASTWLNGRRWEDESHPPSELLPSNINLLDKYF